LLSELPTFASVDDYIASGGHVSVEERPMPELEPTTVVLSDAEQDWAKIEEAVRWCPLHHSLDCSPHRNACSLIDAQRQAFERRKAAADE
jgi:hypothetical protein